MSSGQQSCDEAELAASDWEVATVLATGSRNGLDPSSASTECRSTSISRVRYMYTFSEYVCEECHDTCVVLCTSSTMLQQKHIIERYKKFAIVGPTECTIQTSNSVLYQFGNPKHQLKINSVFTSSNMHFFCLLGINFVYQYYMSLYSFSNPLH